MAIYIMNSTTIYINDNMNLIRWNGWTGWARTNILLMNGRTNIINIKVIYGHSWLPNSRIVWELDRKDYEHHSELLLVRRIYQFIQTRSQPILESDSEPES